MTPTSLTINGNPVVATVEPRMSLADFLRVEQRLTGTHIGCEHGVCGACTVEIDGAPARSCIGFAVALDGAAVRTIEGFEDDPVMARLRAAFQQEHALQCGYCTPGMLITARDIVTRFEAADEQRIRIELAGNLCRCTGYQGIVNAIQRVLREMPATTRLAAARAGVAATAHTVAPPAGARPSWRPFVAGEETPRSARTSRPAAAQAGEAAPEKGWSRIRDAIVVPRPRAEVWTLFGDMPAVARCMPGAQFDSQDGDELRGRMVVAFGPIKANFSCTMTVTRDEATWTGAIDGIGGDERGGSKAKGKVVYRLTELPGPETRIDIMTDYQLQGPLAQFGRSGLVKEFAALLTAQFGNNLSARLAGDPITEQPSSLSAGLAVIAMLRAFKARIGALLGRR